MSTAKKTSTAKTANKLNTALDVLIFILSFTALFLGLIIIQRKYPQFTLIPNIKIPSLKLPEKNISTPTPTPEKTKSISDLSDFGPNTMKDNWEIIQSASVQTDIITFSDCIASPLISRVTQGKTITLKNNDSIEHTILLDDKHTYPLEPKSSISMTVDLENQGLYSYSCDGETSSPKSGGILFITR